MIWNTCFVISFASLAAACLSAIYVSRKKRKWKLLTAFRCVLAGVFMAVFFGLIPLFSTILAGENGFLPKILLFDLVQTIQVFILESGVDFIFDHFNSEVPGVSGLYSLYITFLFAAAPLLAFGFLASLLKDALSK